MQTVLIENKIKIKYFKKEELAVADLGNDRLLYEKTYKIAELMSNQLQISCPDIGFSNTLHLHDDMGRISVLGAMMYTPKDIPTLKNNFILISLEDFESTQFIGTLAHEMRHIWQTKYYPEINENPASGFGESLTHPAEIDADGYAIWYISKIPNMDIEKAADIICSEEKKYHKKEYQMRIDKAYEIKAHFDELEKKMVDEMKSSKKQHKSTFFDKIINFFRNKGEN